MAADHDMLHCFPHFMSVCIHVFLYACLCGCASDISQECLVASKFVQKESISSYVRSIMLGVRAHGIFKF